MSTYFKVSESLPAATEMPAQGRWFRRQARVREVGAPPAICSAGAKPLAVLQVTNMYPSSERPTWGVFIRSQVESLARKGVHSEVLEIEGWRTTLNYLRAMLALPAGIDARRHDLMHLHYGLNALACLGVRGMPMVVSFCGDDFWGAPNAVGRFSRRSLLLAQLSKWACRRADVIIVKSNEMALALGPGYPEVVVIANGLDFELFSPVDRDTARHQLGWPLDQEILFFPADPAIPRKNFALAAAVEDRLKREGRPVVLLSMHGRPQSEVALGMAAADVMLSSSFSEGSPNAMKEAMAMNLPIVSTDVGDCAERLQHCHPGAVVDRNVDAFAMATRAVLDLRGQRSNGREMASALDLDSTATRVVEVYHRAIERYHARRR
jgi:glycosyltransferase involved in cell wall biosynthesis